MSVLTCDVVVVGAGLLGSSVAMHLSRKSSMSILTVDLDQAGVYSSSELNAGGVRATWNHPVNAALSKESIDYYETIGQEIGFLQRGYLWMYPQSSWDSARRALTANPNLQGLGIEYLSPAELTNHFSFIDKTSDLGGATFSPKDGLLNPNLLKLHYRKQAKDRGVQFEDRIWVYNVQIHNDGSLDLKAWRWPSHLSDDELKSILIGAKDLVAQGQAPQGAEPVLIRAKTLVNCSGAWARRFAQCMGVKSQSQPLRRQVCLFDCKDTDLSKFGMFVDASGVYFHPEGTSILAGYATPDEPTGYNLDYDGETFFSEKIWPALYERSTKFENLKHVTGWAGLYEVSPDHSAIIGLVSGFKNVYEAHSFSGRGAMQSYGAGLGLAELIVDKKFSSLDLSALSGNRFLEGRSVSEGLLI